MIRELDELRMRALDIAKLRRSELGDRGLWGRRRTYSQYLSEKISEKKEKRTTYLDIEPQDQIFLSNSFQTCNLRLKLMPARWCRMSSRIRRGSVMLLCRRCWGLFWGYRRRF